MELTDGDVANAAAAAFLRANRACPTDAATRLGGRSYTDAIGAGLLAESGRSVLRVIRPFDAVSADHRDDRLNVELDADGTIRRIFCG